MPSPGSVVVQFFAKVDQARRDVLRFADGLDDVDEATTGLDRSLADVQRAVDATGDTARDAGRPLDAMSTGLDGVADEAERTADRLRRAAADMAAGVRSGGDRIDTETHTIKGNLRTAGAEAGGEFIANMAEGIGSGAGSVTDVVQGTLGGLVGLAGSIAGPVGIAAGVAAAGVGIVFSAVTQAAEKARQQVRDITDALIELGETSSAAAQQALWDQWRASLDDGGKTISEIADGLRLAGVEQGLFQQAITGSAAAQQQVRDRIDEAIAKIEQQRKQQGGLGVLDAQRLNALKLVNRQLDVGTTSLQDANDILADTELLTGDNEAAARDWAAEQRNVYDQTHKIRGELDAIPSSIPVNVIVTMKDRNGRPVHLGPGQTSLPAGPTVAPTAAATTVNVYTDSGVAAPTTTRQLVALLESHSTRMGRRPATPRRAAW